MKILFQFTIYLIILTSLSSKSWGKTKKVKFDVTAHYSQAANAFEIVNFLSDFDNAELLSADYKKYFHQITKSNELNHWLQSFRRLINRYNTINTKETNEVMDLFAFDVQQNVVAAEFYSADNLNQAINTLKTKISGDDLAFLKKFFETVMPKINKELQMSEIFITDSEIINKLIKKKSLKSHFRKVSKFCSNDKQRPLILKLIWAPSPRPISFKIKENVVLVYLAQQEREKIDKLKLLLELGGEFYLSQIPKFQRLAISRDFLKACPNVKNKQTEALRRPLARAVSLFSYFSKKERRKFNIRQYKSAEPWVDIYSMLLFHDIERLLQTRQTLKDWSLRDATELCQKMFALSQ